MYRCQKCKKEFSRKNNMKRHQKQNCKGQKEQDDVVGNILNKVVRRADVMTSATEPSETKNPPTVLPIETMNIAKPKSLTRLAMEIDGKIDSDDSISSEEDETDEDETHNYEAMPDNFAQLKEAFRNMYVKLEKNIEIYDKLVLMLDEMARMNCLTKQECSVMNEHLQKKMGI